MLDSFRHRERALLDDVETLRHRNNTLSDLLDLVTERAESAQKELDRYRAAGPGSGNDGFAGDAVSTGSGPSDALLQKDSEVRIGFSAYHSYASICYSLVSRWIICYCALRGR